MPPPKKRTKSAARANSDESEAESEGEVERSESKAGSSFKEKDGTKGWELGKRKRVTVSEFKGTKYVNIREYYEKDGKMLPGKKGIFLTLEQYRIVTSLKDEIEKEIEAE